MTTQELATLGQRLREQNNRATAHPLFVVQEKVRVYGFDPAYCDNVVWLDNCNDSCEATPEEHAKLEAGYQGTGIEPECWTRTGYHDEWRFVTVCLTEEGAKAYLAANGHNLRRETRIYAESAFRNAEMIALREHLMALPPEAPRSPEVKRDRRRECTCLGVCGGRERLGPNWRCALESAVPFTPTEAPEADERPVCENCNQPIEAGDVVTTLDEVRLHRACAVALWPNAKEAK